MTDIPLFSHVRSFDFSREDRGRDLTGKHACFVEGVLCSIVPVGEDFAGFQVRDCPRFAIRVTHRVFSGEVQTGEDREEWVFPPVNGTKSWLGGVMNCVEVIK